MKQIKLILKMQITYWLERWKLAMEEKAFKMDMKFKDIKIFVKFNILM